MKKILQTILLLSLACIILTGCMRKESSVEEQVSADAASTLTVLNYGEYIDRSVLDLFEEETGVHVLYEEATTPEEMYAKYMSGAIDYDLICTSEYMVQRLIKENQVQDIDWMNVPNSKNIDELNWQMSRSYDPDHLYSLPYFWGTVGILYDTERVKGNIDSWEVLFNGVYAGEIIMPNSLRDAYMCALKYQGHSLNTTDKQELAEAHQLILKQKPDVEAYFVDEVREEMLAGNAILAVCYSGEAALACEQNEKLSYVLPKEGTNIWQDSWIITRRSKHKKNAEMFLDFLCRPDIAQLNFDEVRYPTPNKVVYASLPEDVKEDESIFPSEGILAKSEVYISLDKEITTLYSRMWKELKVQ